MPVSNVRPIYRMRLVVTTCSAQLISHCVNAKITPITINVNRQQPRSARLRPIQKIPTPIKLLISPLPETLNQICKKYSLENSQDKKSSDDTCEEVTPENELINSLPV